MDDKNKPQNNKNNKKLTEKQKNILVTASIVGTVLFNVAISIFQVLKARKK